MRKNLLIGASALAVFAFAGNANAGNTANLVGTSSATTPPAAGETVDVTGTNMVWDADDGLGTATSNIGFDTNGPAAASIKLEDSTGAGAITVQTIDAVDDAAASTLAIDGTNGAVTVNVVGDVSNTDGTEGNNVAITLESTADDATLVFSGEGDQTVTATIDGASAGEGAVSVTNTAGTVTFADAIGATNKVGSFTVAEGATVDFVANDVAVNVDSFVNNGAVETGATSALTAATGLTNAGTLTVGAGGVVADVTNTGTLNLGGDVTGAIDGAGAINVAAASSVDAIGGTTAAGTITVADSVALTAGADVTASSIVLGTAEAGDATLTVNGADSTITGVIDGDADGAGILDIDNTTTIASNVGATHSLATITVDAATTFSGSVSATAIDVNDTATFSGAVTGDIDVATGTANIVDGNVTGDIDGAGTLNLKGAGTVSGSIGKTTALTAVNVGVDADNTTTQTLNNLDTGALSVNVGSTATVTQLEPAVATYETLALGTLDVAGKLNLGTSVSDADGTKQALTSGNVNVAGTGVLDLSDNTVTTTGTVGLATDSTLKTTIKPASDGTLDNAGTFGNIGATGALTVSDDAVVDITVDGYVKSTETAAVNYTLVDTTDGSSNMSTTSLTLEDTYLYDFEHVADNDDLIVSVARKADKTLATATTGSGKTAGAALEADGASGNASADLVSIISTVSTLKTQSEIAAAVTELAPEVNGAGVEGTLAAAGKVAGTVSNRMEAARGYASLGNTGVASGDEWIKGYGVWGKFFGGYAEQDLRDGIDGYEATTLGFALGADKQFTDNMTAGLALSYANSDVDSKDAAEGNNTEIDSYAINLYGTYNNGSPWYVDGQLNFGLSEYDTKRVINFASRTAKGSFDGYQYGAKVGGGYTYDMGSTLVTPMASLQYTRLELDGYTEEGAGGANLKVNEQDYDVLTSELGAKLAVKPFEMSGWTVAPEVHAAWLYDMVKDKAEVTAQFTGGTTSFKTEGKDPAEHTAKVGFGVDVANGQDVTVSVNYDAEIKDEYLGHAGALKVRYDF